MKNATAIERRISAGPERSLVMRAVPSRSLLDHRRRLEACGTAPARAASTRAHPRLPTTFSVALAPPRMHFTTTYRKQQLRQPEAERADRRDHVEVGELHARSRGCGAACPASPRKCIGKNVTLKKIIDSQKCHLPSVSLYMWPVHFGSQ